MAADRKNDSTRSALRWSCRWPALGLLVLIGSPWCAAFADEAIEPQDPQLGRKAEFYRDVYPIFEAKCLACHSGSVKESDLVLDSFEAALRGGASGAAVVPGKAEESLLYLAAARRGDTVMPPLPNKVQAAPLTPRELGVLRDWISGGAVAGERAAHRSLVWHPIPESFKPVYCVALSPEQRFVAAGRGNRILIYDLLSRQEVARLSDPLLEHLQRNGQPLYGPGVAHRDFVHALAFSPDGRLLASGGYRTVKLWERQPPVRLTSLQLPGPVKTCAVDPARVWGAFLLENGEIRLWNLKSGAAGQTLPGDEGGRIALAFSPDGKSLCTAEASGRLRIWSMENGQPAGEFTAPSPITALAIREQGPELVTAHADHLIRCWKWPAAEAEQSAEPPKPVRELSGHSQPITVLQMLNDRQELISGSRDGTVRIWNLNDGKQLFQQPLDGPVMCVTASENGETIIAAGENKRVRIWNRKGEKTGEFGQDPELGRSMALQSEELEIARQLSQQADEKLKLSEKDVQEREESQKKAQEHKSQAEQTLVAEEKKQAEADEKAKTAAEELAKSPEDAGLKKARDDADAAVKKQMEVLGRARETLTSASRSAMLGEQSLTAAREVLESRRKVQSQAADVVKQATQKLDVLKKQWQESGQVMQSLSLLNQDSLVLSAGANRPLETWALPTGLAVESVALGGTLPQRVVSLYQEQVLTVDSLGLAATWNLTPRWSLQATLGPPADKPDDLAHSVIVDRVTALAFSPDGAQLVTAGGEPSRSGELLLWNTSTRELAHEFRDAHSDTVLDVEFSRDGRFLVTGAADKFVKLFKTADGALVRSFEGHTDHVLGVALKADASLIASGSADKAIKIWDAETGEQKRTIDNYSKQVTSVNFTGVGDHLLSCSGDHHVKFHLVTTGQNDKSFVGAEDYVYCAVASRDERLIIAGGEDGFVRVWNAKTGEQLATFGPLVPAAQASVSR